MSYSSDYANVEVLSHHPAISGLIFSQQALKNNSTANNSSDIQQHTSYSLSSFIHPHILFTLCNALLTAAGIIFVAQFGTLKTRRTALYRISIPIVAILLITQQFYFAWLALWAVFHTCAHHFWPFINLKGLNIKASAFPDIVVHLTMHTTVHYAMSSFGVSPITSYASIFILLGCVWNCYLSSYSRVDAPWFVKTSLFQAFSSGSWVAYLITVGSKYQGGTVFEAAMWAFWIGGAVNWFVFKRSAHYLKKLFAVSYLDTLFMIPVFLFIYNNSIVA